MKTAKIRFGLLLIALATLGATQVLAAEGAYRRTCRISGGLNWDVRVPGDIISLCRFGGLGFTNDTFYAAKVEGRSTEAVTAFLAGPTDCEASNGAEINGADLEGVSVRLCTFSDGSIAESAALEAGPGSASALARALGNVR